MTIARLQDSPDINGVHVVHFINGAPQTGTPLDYWPGHITIVPPFELEKDITVGDIVSTVESTFGNVKDPIVLELGERALFGLENKIEAIKMKENDGLRKLHFDLVHALENIGIIFADKAWMLESYNPHSTITAGAELAEAIVCDSLSVNIWRMGQRIIAKTVLFGSY